MTIPFTITVIVFEIMYVKQHKLSKDKAMLHEIKPQKNRCKLTFT